MSTRQFVLFSWVLASTLVPPVASSSELCKQNATTADYWDTALDYRETLNMVSQWINSQSANGRCEIAKHNLSKSHSGRSVVVFVSVSGRDCRRALSDLNQIGENFGIQFKERLMPNGYPSIYDSVIDRTDGHG